MTTLRDAEAALDEALSSERCDWYQLCVERATAHGPNTAEYQFWWSVRYLVDELRALISLRRPVATPAEVGQEAFEAWIIYLDWKLEERVK